MTNFPTAINEFETMDGDKTLAEVGHANYHNTERSAISALEKKVGIDGSADTNSIDYRLAGAESDIDDLEGALPTGDIVGTTDEQTLTNKTLTNPVVANPTIQGSVDGWVDFNQTLVYESGNTVSGVGFLAQNEVGDKIKLNQSIPLTAYFPLEDKDSDVGSFTVADVGTPTYAAGKFSNALTLNGTNQALAITDDALLKPTGAFSIGVWIKSSSTGSSKRIVQLAVGANKGIRLDKSATEKLVFTIGNGTTISTITGTTTIDANWHYVVISYQGNFGKIFLDGVLEASGYHLSQDVTGTYTRIGCSNTAGSDGDWWNGQIDDLFFINGHAVDKYWVAAKYAENTAQGTDNITATYKGYVVAVTNTLLTFAVTSDYTLYDGVIALPYYSKGNALGFPHWFSFNPTLSVASGGTAPTYTENFVNKLSIIGRQVTVQFLWTNTSGGTAGSGGGALSFSPPIAIGNTIRAARTHLGNGYYYESGGTAFVGLYAYSATSIVFVFNDLNQVSGASQDQTDRAISGTYTYQI